MCKFQLLLFLILGGFNCFAQMYLNHTLPRNNQFEINGFSDVAIDEDSHYWCMAQRYYESSGNGVSLLVKLNFNGDTIFTVELTQPSEISYNSTLVLSGNKIYSLSSYKQNNDDNVKMMIVCFNNNGIELWRNVYSNNIASAKRIFFTEDNNLILLGTIYNSNWSIYYPTQFFVTKVNNLDGSVIWSKIVSPSYHSGSTDAIETSNGNILVCGWSKRQVFQNLFETRVVMLSPQGDLIWDKNINVPGVNNGDGKLLELPDGTFLCSTIFFPNNNNTNLINGRLVVFDNHGEIVREKTIQYGPYTTLNQPVLNPDGTFIVYGHKRNHLNQIVGLLIKFDPNLNELWERTYYTREDTPNYIYNMKETTDGGIIFCGTGVTYENNFQRAWIVKTDCFGCDSLLCYYADSSCLVYDCSEYPTHPEFAVSDPVFSTAEGTTFTFSQMDPDNTTMHYWDLGDGTTQMSAQSITHTYAQAGTYTVKLRSHHSACYEEHEQTVVVTQNAGESYALSESGKEETTASLGEETKEQNFKLYPNPADLELYVEFPDVKGSISIINLLGQSVIEENNFSGFALLDVSNLTQGSYLLRVQDQNGQVWTKPLIIQ